MSLPNHCHTECWPGESVHQIQTCQSVIFPLLMDLDYYGDKVLRVWDFVDHIMIFGEVEPRVLVGPVIAPCYGFRDIF